LINLEHLIPFPNQKCGEGEPQTVSIIRQGEADKVSFDLEMKSGQMHVQRYHSFTSVFFLAQLLPAI
jgi:hypothetical protein